ncbi:type I secretion system permease/ATPase [Jannaschia sp. KMU-145]|uniref:type I secretion system permease/ATPase n=1 Tax=Jannaschia halovivens TaxID=3388667 RepID=UPI00396B2BA3
MPTLRTVGTPALTMIAIFSVAVNLLMLTGPLYMLQVYERVLTSRSEATLVALSILAAALFVAMAVLDHLRARIALRLGARLQSALDRHVATATASRITQPETDIRDMARAIDAIRALPAAPVFLALFDLPWTPVLILAIGVFHPMLGAVALAGALLLVGLDQLQRLAIAAPRAEMSTASRAAEDADATLRDQIATARLFGMADATASRWRGARAAALDRIVVLSDRAGAFTTGARTLRLGLQSAMLGAAAFLVIHDELTAGAMFVSALMLGRALAPLEQAIAGGPVIRAARDARHSLAALIGPADTPPRAARDPLTARPPLVIRHLCVAPPGATRPILRHIDLTVPAGAALGVIGLSGAGKTALAGTIAGALDPFDGTLRLGDGDLTALPPDTRAALIGYLPQMPCLLPGSIAENIVRFDPSASVAEASATARAAGADAMIRSLPDGYATRCDGVLPAGLVQRIALTRALHRRAPLLVLDDPTAALDDPGLAAFGHAVRQAKAGGAAVVIMAHRALALRDCETVVVLSEGRVIDHGPRDAVLRRRAGPEAQPSRAAAPS